MITDKKNNIEWQLHIMHNTIENMEWLCVLCGLQNKPNSIQSIDISYTISLNDMNQEYNMHSMGCFATQSQNGFGDGYTKFIPLKLIENWKKIYIHCWFAVQCIHKQPVVV